jgi:hypothetical protein
MAMDFEAMRNACTKMARLTEDPHPGLQSWWKIWQKHLLDIFHAAGVHEDADLDAVRRALEDAELMDRAPTPD